MNAYVFKRVVADQGAVPAAQAELTAYAEALGMEPAVYGTFTVTFHGQVGKYAVLLVVVREPPPPPGPPPAVPTACQDVKSWLWNTWNWALGARAGVEAAAAAVLQTIDLYLQPHPERDEAAAGQLAGLRAYLADTLEAEQAHFQTHLPVIETNFSVWECAGDGWRALADAIMAPVLTSETRVNDLEGVVAHARRVYAELVPTPGPGPNPNPDPPPAMP